MESSVSFDCVRAGLLSLWSSKLSRSFKRRIHPTIARVARDHMYRAYEAMLIRKLVLRERIELSTSPLPMECSTTELPQQDLGLLRPAISRETGWGAASFRSGALMP